MPTTTAAELRLDAAELRNFLQASNRQANKLAIGQLLHDKEEEVKRAQEQEQEQEQEKVKEQQEQQQEKESEKEKEKEEPEHSESDSHITNGGGSKESASSAPANARGTDKNPAVVPGVKYIPIQNFGWDQSQKFVSVYVSEGMEGVKASGADVQCSFDTDSFDLTVNGHNGKSYRLTRRGLEKDIEPKKSKVKVKADRVVVMLRKVAGEYGPDHWMDLVPKRKRTNASKADPTAGIMDMMKDMYDSGDDQMKKTIGEAMLKSQTERMQRGF